MVKRPPPHLPLMKAYPVLITESADELSRLHNTLKDDLEPRGTIERFLVKEMAVVMWDIRRYGRAKTAVINSAFRMALQSLLDRVCRPPGSFIPDGGELAHQWFSTDQSAKQLVLEKLSYFGLNEDAIEAEAMRIRTPELEKFEQMLATREWRLDKLLRSFAELRGVLGQHLRKTAQRVIDGKVLAIGDASKNPPPAAA